MSVLAIDSNMMWAIGLFEGEGSIVFGRGNSVALSVMMTDEDIVRRLHSIMGVGVIHGPYVNKLYGAMHKTVWRWYLTKAENVKAVLELWLPVLGDRRRVKAFEALNRVNQVILWKRHDACPMGHQWTPENTYIAPKTRTRQCRICNNIRARGYRAKEREVFNGLSH